MHTLVRSVVARPLGAILLRVALPVALFVGGCAEGDNELPTGSGAGGGPTAGTTSSSPTGGGEGGSGGLGTTSTGDGGQGAQGGQGQGGGGGEGGAYTGLCPTVVEFQPGFTVSNVRVAGEWQGFDLATAVPMTAREISTLIRFT